jgi:hypothetical protein
MPDKALKNIPIPKAARRVNPIISKILSPKETSLVTHNTEMKVITTKII